MFTALDLHVANDRIVQLHAEADDQRLLRRHRGTILGFRRRDPAQKG